MRRLLCAALLITVAACGAQQPDDPAPASGIPSSPDAFRAGGDRSYAGEWAPNPDQCGNPREVWTIESTRMGVKRERFCVFEVFPTSTEAGQGWSASARCLANGDESRDFVFFRLNPDQQQMRVTINDTDAVELIRCPMRT